MSKELSKRDVESYSEQLVRAAGVEGIDIDGAEVLATGGTLRWIDLRRFVDGTGKLGNGRAFAGIILSREMMEWSSRNEDEEPRYYYLLRLVSSCPVVYKDADQEEICEEACPGDVVALDEKSKLRVLATLLDGGIHVVIIRPHSVVSLRGGKTMWTFDIAKKTLRSSSSDQRSSIPF